jgi:hypothetical protein
MFNRVKPLEEEEMKKSKITISLLFYVSCFILCVIYFATGFLFGWIVKPTRTKVRTERSNVEYNIGDTTVLCVVPEYKIKPNLVVTGIYIDENGDLYYRFRVQWYPESLVFEDTAGANAYICELYTEKIMKLEQKQKEEMEALELERDKACNFGGKDGKR